MLKNELPVTRETLLNEVAARRHLGFRFVTVTCVDLGDRFDIIYHFDKDYCLHSLRLSLGRSEELPSISPIFFAAVLVENELKDLFGIPVTDLAIDYGGRFLLSEGCPVAPQRKPDAPAQPAQTKDGAAK
jgi:Ni,Fe-hydrogenase III component G